MEYVERASYRAVVRPGVSEPQLQVAVGEAASSAERLVEEGKLLTAGLYRYHEQLFLYLEHIYEAAPGGESGSETGAAPSVAAGAAPEDATEVEPKATHEDAAVTTPGSATVTGEDRASCLIPVRPARPDFEAIRKAPEGWGWLEGLLEPFPSLRGPEAWAYMYPVFWFDEPTTVESYLRKPAPDARCGRIARLYPTTLMDYVCHHQAIAREGKLVGDRFQFISLHDDVLFSYFECPRDRGKRSVTGDEGPSEEIERWLAVDPASHFDHFAEANGDDFLIIDTLFATGR